MRKLNAVPCVAVVILLSLGFGQASASSTHAAASKYCGSLKPKSPPMNNPVKLFKVTLLAGPITCIAAEQMMAKYYVGPGSEGGGPPNVIRNVFKNGYTCLQAGDGVTDAPITCMMGKNRIRATLVT